MIRIQPDICFICGQDVETTLDGERFCKKCGWIEEDEMNTTDVHLRWSESQSP